MTTPLIVDADVHNFSTPELLAPYLSERWSRYLDTFGVRTRAANDLYPSVRAYASRHDTMPPSGGPPGSDPDLARAQHLDEHGVALAILNNMPGLATHHGWNHPAALGAALSRANNDWALDVWFEHDQRWCAGICIGYEDPEEAVREVVRCRELSSRFVHGLFAIRTERPIGNPRYWPLLEALAALEMPVAFHPGGSGGHAVTGTGWPSFYFENHCGLPIAGLSHLASLVFEGAFDRFPTLKVVLIESNWSWAAPFAWRLDALHRVHRDEVPDLQRRPSEYLAEHVWFTTQPMEEPETPRWLGDVYAQFVEAGLGGHLMFSSDYPHWDFDSPHRALRGLPTDDVPAILADNAIDLFGLNVSAAALRCQTAPSAWNPARRGLQGTETTGFASADA